MSSNFEAADAFDRRLSEFASSGSPDDPFAVAAIREATRALREGNFGAGCVLRHPKGNIVVRNHNRVFVPRFRSDAHAEMLVVNEFERMHRTNVSKRGYTLYASLEPCPMCTARLITFGCETVRYVTPDPHGGMVHLIHQLPGVWPELARRQKWEQAHCSRVLQELALEVFEASIRLNEVLREH